MKLYKGMFICCFWMFTFPYMTTAQFNKKEIALNISCENVYDVILLTPSNRYVKLISKIFYFSKF